MCMEGEISYIDISWNVQYERRYGGRRVMRCDQHKSEQHDEIEGNHNKGPSQHIRRQHLQIRWPQRTGRMDIYTIDTIDTIG